MTFENDLLQTLDSFFAIENNWRKIFRRNFYCISFIAFIMSSFLCERVIADGVDGLKKNYSFNKK